MLMFEFQYNKRYNIKTLNGSYNNVIYKKYNCEENGTNISYVFEDDFGNRFTLYEKDLYHTKRVKERYFHIESKKPFTYAEIQEFKKKSGIENIKIIEVEVEDE